LNNFDKYASCLDWRNPHIPIAVTASGGQFVTQASRLPGRGLTPGPKFTKSWDDLVDSEIYHPA